MFGLLVFIFAPGEYINAVGEYVFALGEQRISCTEVKKKSLCGSVCEPAGVRLAGRIGLVRGRFFLIFENKNGRIATEAWKKCIFTGQNRNERICYFNIWR